MRFLARRRRAPGRIVTLPDDRERAQDFLVYQLASDRELDQNALMWQTPALSLAAQAFLMTTALGADTADLARIIAAVLGVAVAVLSIQLMLKHRFLSDSDAAQMRTVERKYGMPALRDRKDSRGAFVTRMTGINAIKSHQAWVWLLGLFGAANVAVIAVTLWAPELLNSGA